MAFKGQKEKLLKHMTILFIDIQSALVNIVSIYS